tara:strand:- start:1497 stop:2093 length:597 start_codon:yes stop_codon:yes gene_type:complete
VIDDKFFCTCLKCKQERYYIHLAQEFNAGKYTLDLLNDRWHQSMMERIPWRFSIKIETVSEWMYSVHCHHNILRHTIPEGSKVLDLACGIGQLASYFNEKDYLGIDIYIPAIEYCKIMYPRHEFLSIDLFDADFLENTFDFIIASGFEINNKIFSAISSWGKNILHFSYTPQTKYILWNKETNKTITENYSEKLHVKN